MSNTPTIAKADRMRIQQFDPNDKTAASNDTYHVLVNPTSYGVTHAAFYDKSQDIQGTGTTYSFNKVKPQGMKIELLFDSTGSFGNEPTIVGKSVLTQINEFMEVAFISHGKNKKPKFLWLIWGDMQFKGVLESIDITYSHFDPTGAPIRASASCSFTGGYIRFEEKEKPKVTEAQKPRKVIDYANVMHPVNALKKHGGYLSVISQQAKKTMPKSLRKVKEVAKMIVK